jgi:hypothetical protein
VYLFNPPKNPILPHNFGKWKLKFKNFGFHLSKFPDVEKHVFSTAYFSLGGV